MAKASRSSKKQPAFDPTELSDLIFSPAVGSGVGSHLLEDMSTVDRSEMTTVDELHSTTVNRSPTVVNTNLPTVDISNLPTVDISNLPTVDMIPSPMILWITEQGSVVGQGRVRRIGLATDVINPAEERVYETLWTANSLPAEAPGESDDPFRVVEAGYDYLVKRTHFSKRTIQRIVEKLIDKDFIAIERPADIYRRSSTVYRVFSPKIVLDRHARKGRHHVAKLGPGFSYVRQLGETGPL